MKDLDQLVRALKRGVVTISFQKIDTKEIRHMVCTIKTDVMEGTKLGIRNIHSESKSIVVYALDKKAIRDVMVDTIQSWESWSEEYIDA